MANYVKNEKAYQRLAIETKKIKEAYKKLKARKRQPTSINLSTVTLAELKKLAAKKGLPYQTLMRQMIVEGIKKLKKAA